MLVVGTNADFKILKLVGADVERTMGHNNVAMSGQVLLVNL